MRSPRLFDNCRQTETQAEEKAQKEKVLSLIDTVTQCIGHDGLVHAQDDWLETLEKHKVEIHSVGVSCITYLIPILENLLHSDVPHINEYPTIEFKRLPSGELRISPQHEIRLKELKDDAQRKAAVDELKKMDQHLLRSNMR